MPRRMTQPTLTIQLTPEELALVCEALDSHAYWELSEPCMRSSGFVQEPGSGDAGVAAEIRRANDLHARLAALRPG